MFWFNGLSGTMDARENEVVLTNALVYIWKRLRDDRSVPMSNELVLSAESVTNNYQQFTILIGIFEENRIILYLPVVTTARIS